MKARVLAIARWGLLIWGAFSLCAIIATAALAAYQLSYGNRDKSQTAAAKDVRFVLNWCDLGDQRIEKVLHSHVSARSFTGDHLDAHAIRISHIGIDELTNQKDELHGRWYRGDQLPEVVSDAVNFAGGWLHELPWFPTVDQLRSSEVYVYPWSIHLHGVRPSAAELIFIRPSDKMVFYFGGKT